MILGILHLLKRRKLMTKTTKSSNPNKSNPNDLDHLQKNPSLRNSRSDIETKEQVLQTSKSHRLNEKTSNQNQNLLNGKALNQNLTTLKMRISDQQNALTRQLLNLKDPKVQTTKSKK